MTRYVIRGGKEGKERLKLISEVLLPTTYQLLHTVGLSQGMKCLDVGCGGGFVTLLLASIVGPQGKAVGIDADGEQLVGGRRGKGGHFVGVLAMGNALALLAGRRFEYSAGA